jgi:aspartate/methionine/tyrosine aminotransferase
VSKSFSPYFADTKKGEALNFNSEILVGCGASELLFCAVHHMVGPGDEVLMFEPYFSQYTNYIAYSGADVNTAPMYKDQEGNW